MRSLSLLRLDNSIQLSRPCNSIIAPMEHQCYSSRGPSRIEHPKETPDRIRVTHPPPTEVGPTIKRRTTSARSGTPCTSESTSSRGGTSQLSTTMTHPSCNCDDTDVDTTYRVCCITVGNSPSFSAATLSDTGAHTSFLGK